MSAAAAAKAARVTQLRIVLVATAATGLSVELGAEVANEDYVEGVVPASAKLIAAQASRKLTHNFNESVSFSATLTAYEPVLSQSEGSELSPYFTDLRIANTTTLSATLSDRFSVSVSDTLAWRNEPVEALTLTDWQAIKAAVAPFASWRATPAGPEVGGLGIARIQALVQGNAQATLIALIERNLAQKPQADALDDLIRLVSYHAHLGQILRSFVNFADFYRRKVPALFQAGRAWFDQRSYDVVLPAVDAGRHASMAGRAGIYLAYLDCTRRSDGLNAQVCVAVTDGDSDNLMVGRNGLYYDREGRDYDATVTRVIDNPISLRQAFWSPYKKFVRTVEDMVAARAKAAEAKSDAAISAAADVTANADTKAPPVPAPGIDVGTVAAIGVAVGGISTVVVGVISGILGLGRMTPLAFLGLMLLISGPSVLIAALKLRQRNLGPLLNADGWAVNAPAFVKIPFGRSLTQMAELPDGSQRHLADPFVEKRSRAPFFITALVLLLGGGSVLWKMGWVTFPGV